MKRSWQKILAMLCAMMLILTGVLAVGFADEALAENVAPVETEELTAAPTEEPATADTAADSIEAVEAPAQEAEAPVAEEPAQETEAPVAVEEVAQETETPVVVEEPAQETEAPVTEEPVQETEAPVVEEPAQETEAPAAETDQSSETPAPVEEPAAEAEATEAPAAELIPADMTLKTLIQGVGTASANKPYIVRLVSNVTGKVKVTLKAESELFVQFGKDGGEISREILPNEEGDISFTFGAEFDKSYLLYIYSIGVNAETGLVIESVPFRISSEKVEPVTEELPAEELVDEVVPAEPAEDIPAEEVAEEVPAEEAAAEEIVPADAGEEALPEETAADAEETPAEEPDAEETAPVEEPAAEESAEEEGLIIYDQDNADADEEIDEYETALGLYEVKYVITAEEADIRVEADGMSPIMATVPEGTALKGFVTDDGDWMLVIVNGELGYVYKNDLASTEEETTEEVAEEIPEEAAEEIPEVAAEEIPEEAAEEIPEEAAEETAEAEEIAEQKVTIFTSRRVYMTMGEPVYLTSELEGFEGLETVFQWECDKGEGFEPVEGADEDHYTFIADAESLSWGWKLLVYYR